MFRRVSRPGKAGPGPPAPRPAPTGRASAPLDARRPSGRRPRPPAANGVAAALAHRGGDTSGEKRVRHPKFSACPCPRGCALPYAAPLCQSRVASINAKSPPPFAGKRAPCIYDSQAFSARNFSSGSISMLSSGMGSDLMRLRPRNSLAAMAAKISAKPLIILTVIASL